VGGAGAGVRGGRPPPPRPGGGESPKGQATQSGGLPPNHKQRSV